MCRSYKFYNKQKSESDQKWKVNVINTLLTSLEYEELMPSSMCCLWYLDKIPLSTSWFDAIFWDPFLNCVSLPPLSGHQISNCLPYVYRGWPDVFKTINYFPNFPHLSRLPCRPPSLILIFPHLESGYLVDILPCPLVAPHWLQCRCVRRDITPQHAQAAFSPE